MDFHGGYTGFGGTDWSGLWVAQDSVGDLLRRTSKYTQIAGGRLSCPPSCRLPDPHTVPDEGSKICADVPVISFVLSPLFPGPVRRPPEIPRTVDSECGFQTGMSTRVKLSFKESSQEYSASRVFRALA